MKSNLTYVRRFSLLISILVLGYFIALMLTYWSLPSFFGVGLLLLTTFLLAKKQERFKMLFNGVIMGAVYFSAGHLGAWLDHYFKG